jgi:hypothetical protein
MDIIQEDIKKMGKLCEEYNRDMPTEIKLIYNVVEKNLKTDYRCDTLNYNDTDKRTPVWGYGSV